MQIIPDRLNQRFYSVSGIYAIIFRPTGRIYIGSSGNIGRRWAEHRRFLNDGKHVNYKLQSAWKKHPPESFAFCIVEIISDVNDLVQKEQWWINAANAANKHVGFNIDPRVRKRVKRILSPEHRAKISATHKGKIASAETRAKMSLAQLARSAESRANCGIRKIDEGIVCRILRQSAAGETTPQLAKEYGLSRSHINCIRRGVVWHHAAPGPGIREAAKINRLNCPRPSPTRNKRMRGNFRSPEIEDIKRRLQNGESQAAIARVYNVHYSTICQIKRRRGWDI